MRTLKRSYDLAIPNPRNGNDEMNIIVSVSKVDNGIGAYEFWGATGTHHQWEIEWELESCPIPDEEIYDNQKLCNSIQERVEELWSEEEANYYEGEREEA